MWPGITLHHTRVMAVPRWEDFEYTYRLNESGVEDNPFSYLGKGVVPEMLDHAMDDSPHIAVGKIDPTWAGAMRIRLGNETEVDEEDIVKSNVKANAEVESGYVSMEEQNEKVGVHSESKADGVGVIA